MKVDNNCGTCGTYYSDEKCMQHFSQKNWREETTWTDLKVDVRISLQYALNMYGVGMQTGYLWLRKGPVVGFSEQDN
jgi:hypothetical protein